MSGLDLAVEVRSKQRKVNTTDPEADVMSTAKGFVQRYNAQAVANDEQVVVSFLLEQAMHRVPARGVVGQRGQHPLVHVGLVPASPADLTSGHLTAGMPAAGPVLVDLEWKLIRGTHNLLKLYRRVLADPSASPYIRVGAPATARTSPAGSAAPLSAAHSLDQPIAVTIHGLLADPVRQTRPVNCEALPR